MAVVQAFIIYGSETWVMTPHIGRFLGGFHHRVDHRLTGRQPRRVWDSVWVYPLLEYAMAGVGLLEVETYVSRRQNSVAQFIAARTIRDLCLEAERRLGSRLSKRWWEKDGLELEGIQTVYQEVERKEG